MCNKYPNRRAPDAMFEPFAEIKIPYRWAEGAIPNQAGADEVSIRDTAPIICRAGEAVEAAMLPWAWAGPGGKPVFNFRSDGRSFANSARCLIPADGFFEFTTPADPKAKRKHKHLFTLRGEDWLWIAGVVRDGAFAMLTTEPGPDIASFHDRQVVVLRPADGLAWLDLTRPERELLRPLPPGSLLHTQLA